MNETITNTNDQSNNYAIRVMDVSKMYKLYDRNRDRVRDALSLSGKKKLYKEHYALNHVSFDVKKGEAVGIIGTNGAGKSTILKIITGVLSPTDGDVEINGRISALLELGAGFNNEYTGIENIYLNGTMMGFSREEVDARMQDILDFADIGNFVYQPVKSYSSGMFVRLAFAVAINIDPEILIVDEALSVGDVFFQAKCYKKFEDFKAAGKTIIFVSHDLGSIQKYCDRAILLNKGNKVFEGAPKDTIDLYKKYLVNQVDDEGRPIDHGVSTAGDDKAATGWRSNFQINPNVNPYGDGDAEITDFAVVDQNGNFTTTIEKGTSFTIKYKVRFNSVIQNPIFTYSFKNVYGVTITGTNTMYEKVDIGTAYPGDEYIVSFTQDMALLGGEYLMSISCTGYLDGEFHAYHRLYDLLNITVISDKDAVGYYDMFSEASIEKA